MKNWEKLLSLAIACLLVFTLIRASIIAAGSLEESAVIVIEKSEPDFFEKAPIWNGVNGR